MDDNKDKIVGINLPGNSRKEREERKEKKEEPVKKVNKVIKGSVVTKKKSLGKRISETFLGDDVESVGSYIIHDIIIPATKNTISDMVSGGIEMLMFGETRGSRTRRDKGKSYVSYSSYYGDRRGDKRDRDRGRDDRDSRNRARHNFDDIILESRGEAEEVLSNMVDLIADYDTATVADLYDLVGMTSNYTDRNWGWENLRSASVSRVRDGYRMDLPKPILLKD